jgi:hypothetical protein
MDTGTILGLIVGYLATLTGIFLLYSPVIILFIALLIAGGILQLLLMPFVLLIRRLRRRTHADTDPSWLLDRGEG